MHKSVAKLLTVLAVLGVSLAGRGAPSVVAQTPGQNLLTNGDFEAWDWAAGHWPLMWGIPEVQVAPGWQAFWIQDAPEDAPMRENWKRPEFRDVKIAEASYRVHGGTLAQKYFSFGGQHIAGIYQQVTGITPGATLRFQIYMQTWGCMAGDQGWNICPTGHESNSPSPFHTRVGIDPTGGTSHGAGTVVWGPEQEAYDNWVLFTVDAVAQSSTVTVFTYSHADWWDNVFRMHNDVYIDDASLVVLDVPLVDVSQPAPAEPAAPAAPAEPAEVPAAVEEAEEPEVVEPAAAVATWTPAPTPTPRPDGAVVHIVQSGDTLNAIALDYDVEPEQIKELNDIGDGAWLSVGQELVISVDPGAVRQTATDDAGAAAEIEDPGNQVEAALPTATVAPAAAAEEPVAVAIALPTPTPALLQIEAPAEPLPTPTAQPEPDSGGDKGGFPFIPVTLAVVAGVGLGVVLNGRIRRP